MKINRLRSTLSLSLSCLYANQRSALQITSFVHKSLEILLCCCTRKHSDLYALFITSQEIIDIYTWTNSFEALLHIDWSLSRAEITRTWSTPATTTGRKEFQKTHFREPKVQKRMQVVENRVHVLITHMKAYFLEKRESGIFDRARERASDRESAGEKAEKRKKEGIHKYTDTQTAVIYRTFASDQLCTHDNIIGESYVFPFVRARTRHHPDLIVCCTYLRSHRHFFNSMSSRKESERICVPSGQYITDSQGERETCWFSFLCFLSLFLSISFSITSPIICMYLHTKRSRDTEHRDLLFNVQISSVKETVVPVHCLLFSDIFLLDWFEPRRHRMGSFLWDDDFDDMCYSQHHNGRPLSVALTEPFDPFEPQTTSFFDDIPYIESDFASLHRHHHHQHQHQHQHRSRSSGRRYKRECYSTLECDAQWPHLPACRDVFPLGVHYPYAHPNTYCFSPPPLPPPRRQINRVASREVLIEKIGKHATVKTISGSVLLQRL